MASLFVFLGVGELSIDLSESISDSFSEFFPGVRCLQVVVIDILEVEVAYNKSGGHDMALVDKLDKRFDSSLLDEFLLVERSLGSNEVSGDTGDEQVREFVSLSGTRYTLLPVS